MKKGDIVFCLTSVWNIPNNLDRPVEDKEYVIMGFTLNGLGVKLMCMNCGGVGYDISQFRKAGDDFTNALTRELAFKTKWTEEEYHPGLQKRELNPRKFTTKEDF